MVASKKNNGVVAAPAQAPQLVAVSRNVRGSWIFSPAERLFVWGGITTVIWLLGNTAVSADWLQSWVAVTCDSVTNQALVRFGYADGNSSPTFVQIPKDIDGGLSLIPVSDPHLSEASCTFPDGREVKVRKGYLPKMSYGVYSAAPAFLYSVWANKVRIIQGEDVGAFPFGVIVGVDRFRRCRNLRASYDLITVGGASVECDKNATLIAGGADRIEYPPNNLESRKKIGSISIVYSREKNLCKALIKKNQPSRHTAWLLEPGEIGWGDETISTEDINEMPEIELKSVSDSQPITSFEYDLYNSGNTQKIYEYTNFSRAFDANFFVVTPRNTQDKEVIAFFSGVGRLSQFDKFTDDAKSKGWKILSGAQTPYKNLQNLRVKIISYRKKSYLLVLPSDDTSPPSYYQDPTGVVMKLGTENRIEKACVFQRVYPHY
jgi:hypothetical protein